MRFVVGLLFSEARSHVALILKDRPQWQWGKFNAPGGKIEGEESALNAVKREFLEETGVAISAWKPVSILCGDGFEVHFFAAFSNKVHECRTMETEKVFVLPLMAALTANLIPGLATHLMLALDDSGVVKPVMISSKLKGG